MPAQTEEQAQNIMALAQGGWAAKGDAPVFSWHDDELQWHDVTGNEAMDMVRRAALGLIALGVKEDDRVAIMAKTRYEWTIIDFALWSVGAIPVPIYDTSSQDQIDWITSDARVTRVFVETAKHAALARAVAAQSDSPLDHVHVIDDGALDDLYRLGEGGDEAEIARRSANVLIDDLATIIYTSGTTGRPKGVRLNHFHFVLPHQGHPGRSARGPLPGRCEHDPVHDARSRLREAHRDRAARDRRRRGILPRFEQARAAHGHLQADAARRRAARVREGLQRRGADRGRRRQGQDLPVGGEAVHRLLDGARHPVGTWRDAQAAARRRAQARAAPLGRPRWRQSQVGGLRFGTARRAARPLLPRPRHHACSRATASPRPRPRATSTARRCRRSGPWACRCPTPR